MKKYLSSAFSVFLLFTIIFSTFFSAAPVSADEIVTFPDPNLETAIREAIGKPTGDIYNIDLQTIITFTAMDKNISNLTGLEYCVNLQVLDLTFNQISDVSPLANLTSLIELHISGNHVSDISSLNNLVNLTWLNICDNQIVDISSIANLTSLTKIGLSNNLINDITAVSNLTELIILTLDNNQINDISALTNLTNLSYINLNDNQISDISALTNLAGLEVIQLEFNQVNDISSLANLTNVISVYLNNNQISDISSLAYLTKLNIIYLRSNQISDISPLSNLASLTDIQLDYNQIGDISPLNNLSNLVRIYLTNNQISNISPLANLGGLIDIQLGHNQISDIQPLTINPGIDAGDSVHLGDNPLSAVSVNTYIPQLQLKDVTVYYDIIENGTISGTVIDAITSLPIANLMVSAGDTTSPTVIDSATTDVSGYYTLDLPPGTYRIYANGLNTGLLYATKFYNDTYNIVESTFITLAEDEYIADINFSLEPGSLVSGTVIASDTQQPLQDIFVFFSDNVTDQVIQGAITGWDGYYSLVVPTGTYYARTSVFKPDIPYTGEYYLDSPDISTATQITVTVPGNIAGIDFSLNPPGGTISGTITDASTSLPISNITVWFGEAGIPNIVAFTATDANGHYSFELPAGTYIVHAGGVPSEALYAGKWYDDAYLVLDITQVTVAGSENVTGIDINLQPGSIASGTVIDNVTSQPISGMFVNFTDNVTGQVSEGAITDQNGNYSVVLPEGVYIAQTLSHIPNLPYTDEYYYDAANVQQAMPIYVTVPGNITGINFSLNPKQGTISGTVLDSVTSLPVNNMRIEATDSANNTLIAATNTDSSGAYTLQVPAGSYNVQAKGLVNGLLYVDEFYNNAYHIFSATQVLVSAGADVTGIDFNLEPGSIISGTAIDSDTLLPISNLLIGFINLADNSLVPNTVTNQDGYFEVVLPPGEYSAASIAWFTGLSYVDEYYNNTYRNDLATPFIVTLSSPVTGIDFSLETGGAVTGTITDSSTSQPLNLVFVQAYDYSTGEFIAQNFSNASGNYTLRLPAGTYRLKTNGSIGAFNYADEYYSNSANYTDAIPVAVTVPGLVSGIDFSLAPNIPASENNVWAGFWANLNFTPSEDFFTNHEVTGAKSWSTNINNSPDTTGQPVTSTVLKLTAAQPVPPYLFIPGPNTIDGNIYQWQFGDIYESAIASANANSMLPGATNYTPGFDVTRSIYPATLYADGDQTLTIQVTPRENINQLNVNVIALEDYFVNPVITSPVTDPASNIFLSADGRFLNMSISNPVVGQVYTWTVTIHVYFKGNVVSMEYMPAITIGAQTPIESSTVIDNHVLFSDPDLGSWEWSATGNYLWNRNTFSQKNIQFQSRAHSTWAPGGFSDNGTMAEQWRFTYPGNIINRMAYGSSPAIADLGPDVNNVSQEPAVDMEIITGSDEMFGDTGPGPGYWRALDSLGGVEWTTSTGSDQSRSSPVIADINGDGFLEIAAGTTSGKTVEVMDRFGNWFWTFPTPPSPGSFEWPSSPAVADFVPDFPGKELVILHKTSGKVFAFDGDNADGINDGISVSGWNGVEGTDWDVLWTCFIGGPEDWDQVSSPSIGDVDGDGVLEIIIGSANGDICIIDGRNGNIESTYRTGGKVPASAALADIDADGLLEIIIGSLDGSVYCLQWDCFNLNTEWSFATGQPVYSSAAIGDTDADGAYEIIVGSNNGKVYCISATGTEEWSYQTGGAVYSSPALADMEDVQQYDKDWPMFRHDEMRSGLYGTPAGNALEVYIASDDGCLYRLNGATGQFIDRFHVFGPVHTSPGVADVDGDSLLEVFFSDWSGEGFGHPDTFWALETGGIPTLPAIISGTVLDAITGQPLSNITITAGEISSPISTINTITDASGNYTLELPPGTYRIRSAAIATGQLYADKWYDNAYAFIASSMLTVIAGDNISNINFSLEPGSLVSGIVTDADTLQPIQTMFVRFSDYNSNQMIEDGVTNQNGNYSVVLPPGTYRASTLSIIPGLPYIDKYYNDTYLYHEALPITVTLSGPVTGINFSLSKKNTISGTVTDNTTSLPIANMHIDVFDYNTNAWTAGANTDINGNYIIEVPAGNYKVRTNGLASGTLYVDEYYDNIYASFLATQVTVTEGNNATGINFSLVSGGLVTGSAIDNETLQPIPNLNINFINSVNGIPVTSAQTDASGHYSIVLPPGTYKAITSARISGLSYVDEYYGDTYNINLAAVFTVTAGGTVNNIDFSLATGGTITGKVIDVVTSQPLFPVFVAATDYLTGEPIGQVLAGPDGNYTINLPTGIYRIGTNAVLISGNYTDEYYSGVLDSGEAIPVRVTIPDNTPYINFQLRSEADSVPCSTISGRITDAYTSDPIANLVVYASEVLSTTWTASATTNENGEYTLNMPTGTFMIRSCSEINGQMYANRFYNSTYNLLGAAQVTVGKYENVSGIDFSLEPGIVVSGTVIDGVTSQPISNVFLYAKNTANSYNHAIDITDANGNYSFILPAGAFIVGTDASRRALEYVNEYYDNAYTADNATVINVTVPGNISGINFSMNPPNGTVFGTVIDAETSLPISNMTVWIGDIGVPNIRASTTTDINGHYSMQVAAGTYIVRTAGFLTGLMYADKFYNDTYQIFEIDQITVTGGGSVTGIDFSLEPGSAISGTAIDSGTLLPIATLFISFTDNVTGQVIASSITGAIGQYSIILPEGTYTAKTASFITGLSYIDEYYNNTTNPAEASLIYVTVPGNVTGIDFLLNQSTPANTISGTITDAATTLPIANLCVEASDNATNAFIASANTDINGHYTIQLPGAGTFKIKTNGLANNLFYVDEYYNDTTFIFMATPVTVTSGANVTGIDFSLNPGGKVTGTATDNETLQPIPNLFIIFNDEPAGTSFSATTDASGNFTVVVPPGTYKAHSGALITGLFYVDEYFGNTYRSDLASTFTVTVGWIEVGIDFSLAIGGRVTGTITDAATSQPVSSVFVRATDFITGEFIQETLTLPFNNGNYSLNLPTGSYRIKTNAALTGQSYLDMYYNNTADYNQASPVAITVPGVTPNINFSLVKGGAVSGYVFDDYGDPIPYARVAAFAWDNTYKAGETVTDQTGFYRLTNLAPSDYRVHAWGGPGYVQKWWYDSLIHDLAAPVSVTAPGETAGINFNLGPGGTITGRVIDSATFAPVANVFVDASDLNGVIYAGIHTNSNGEFTLAVPAGNYVVGAHPSLTGLNYLGEFYDNAYFRQNASPVFVTAPNNTPDINISLETGSIISGTVIDAGTLLPIANMRVSASEFNTNEFIASANTDASGNYTLRVPPGSFRVRAEASATGLGYIDEFYNNQYGWHNANPVTVQFMGETVIANFSLSAGGTITGTVIDTATSLPVSNIHVYATESVTNEWTAGTFTDINGHFTLRVPTGSYKVGTAASITGLPYIDELFDNQYGGHNANPVTVTAPGVTPDINFSLSTGATIKGTVYDAVTLQPIANMHMIATEFTNNEWTAGAFTDSSGNYTLKVPYGTYKVQTLSSITGLPYVDEFFDNKYVWEPANPVIVASLDGVSSIDFSLDAGGTISGTILDADTLLPVANMHVDAIEYTTNGWGGGTNTDASGNYTIRVPAGIYRVRTNSAVNGQLYANKYFNTYNHQTATQVTAAYGVNTAGIDISLEKGSIVSGTVYDSNTSQPIANILLSFTDYTTNQNIQGTITDQSGSYSVIMPPGTFRVQAVATHNGLPYINEFYDGTYQFNQAAPLTVTLGSNISGLNFNLESGGTISGTVIDDTTSLPLANCTIVVFRTDFGYFTSTVTGASGNYSLRVPAGTYYAGTNALNTGLFYADKHYNNTYTLPGEQITVTENGIVQNVNFSLEPGGVISGTVTDNDTAQPVPQMFLQFTDIATGQVAGVVITGQNGNYSKALPPASYRIETMSSATGLPYADKYYNDTYIQSQATAVTVAVNVYISGIDFHMEQDITPPVITISGVSDGQTYYDTVAPVITVTDANPGTQSITLNGFPFVSGAPVSADGSYTIYAEATDLFNNTSNTTLRFTIIRNAPRPVTVRLINSAGAPIEGGVVKYYNGGWQDFGITDVNGETTMTLTPKQYSFRMTYAYASNDKSQNIGANPLVTFQTANVSVQLRNSIGDLIDTGEVKYYAGGWRSFGITSGGQVNKELLPNTYSFRMSYGYASNDKSQNIGSDPVVIFQTANVTVQLKDSLGNLIDTGEVKYYAGGWRNFGATSGGVANLELLPNTYSFRITYGYASNDKSQNIATDPVVAFQTTNVVVQLKDSNNSFIDTGEVKYYAGGWRDFGVTTGGQVYKELLPNTYSFRMAYGYASNDKSQNIGAEPVVTFQTTSVSVQLKDNDGNPLDAGTVKYYAGGWREFGVTSGGQISKELLPNSYSFRMTYGYASNDKSQNIGGGPAVVFQTGLIVSETGSCTYYYAGGWRAFTSGTELLPNTYTFRFNDGTADTAYEVKIDTINYIY